MIQTIYRSQVEIENQLYEIASEIALEIKGYEAYAQGMKKPSVVFRKIDEVVMVEIDGRDPSIRVGETFESPANVYGCEYLVKVTRLK